AASPPTFAEPPTRLLASFALPVLAMMLAVSFLSRANANWAAPAFVSATVLVVAWAMGRGWHKLVIFSVALHLAAAALLLTGREAMAALGIELPAKYDALGRLRGWGALGSIIGGVAGSYQCRLGCPNDRRICAGD